MRRRGIALSVLVMAAAACASSTDAPALVGDVTTTDVNPNDAATTTAPVTTQPEPEPEPTVPPAAEEPVVLTTSPDGEFVYSAQYAGRDGLGSGYNGVILVDDGTGPSPALRDDRDTFDSIHDMIFGPDGLVAWTSDDDNYGSRVFVGRIVEGGQILDSHRVGDETDDVSSATGFDDNGILAATSYEGAVFALDTTADPFFVMTADPAPRIDADTPLVAELEHEGYWARDEPGSWYRGDTLGPDPACGLSTLYKDDADGFARVLHPSIEIDTAVDVDVTGDFDMSGFDVAGSGRAVVISTECPAAYTGRMILWGIERIDYGDGGPRFEKPLVVEPAPGAPVAEVTGVETVTTDDCCGPRVSTLQVDVELLDGTRTTIEITV